LPDIAQATNNLQDFAARRKHSAVGALVSVESMHELDFLSAVITLACCRIDLPAARGLPALRGARASLSRHGNVLLPAILASAIVSTTVNLNFRGIVLRHELSPGKEPRI
jgi:hypothetical protein